eukprot:TRINITY_DN3190_c0_g1_i1.p1 TRINITY_DN3190_c0_g1~~TRINITY_DN3190_c0_g1_i1.p1  ORF type:complete len:115 (-),score=2.22 TRINITY_DN3190_c0_g1_i1:231-533(-)
MAMCTSDLAARLSYPGDCDRADDGTLALCAKIKHDVLKVIGEKPMWKPLRYRSQCAEYCFNYFVAIQVDTNEACVVRINDQSLGAVRAQLPLDVTPEYFY